MFPSSKYQPYAEYLRYLAEEDVEKLWALEEAVESLDSHPGWKELEEIMSAGARKIDEILMDGATLEQADYARVLGFKAGLRQMPNAIKAIRAACEAKRDALEKKANEPEVPEEMAPDGLTPAT